MQKKHCLFCDQIVPIEAKGDYDRYLGCYCAPEHSYDLLRDSYGPINNLTHSEKREIFPLISAYIREKSDQNEHVALSAPDLDSIKNSPEIPLTLEEKGLRLLQYIYRHSEEAGEAVVIHPLGQNFNLTYSPNLQELVYILDQLSGSGSLVREGIYFKLTEKGWKEAAERAGGRKLKPCYVILGKNDDQSAQWAERVLPKLEQFGYLPRLYDHSGNGLWEDTSFSQLPECKLVIADLSSQAAEVYFAAGYAQGLRIPVIWTVNSSQAEPLAVQPDVIRPLLWDSLDDLSVILQQKLNQ